MTKIKTNIEEWDVENTSFWDSSGKVIANRNLWISIPALLLAFAIWLMWGMVIVQMKKLGFTLGLPHQTPEELKVINELLWTLPAIAGLAGATLRIPNSFLIAVGGGRNVIFLTTGLLLIPAVGAGIALQNPNTPFVVFALLAALSGFGGGNFASSMSNISYFFPKRVQGTSLGLNAGLGNLGVSVMQFLIPWVIGAAIFGSIAGKGLPLVEADGTKAVGTLVFIQNAGWIWVPMLIVSVAAAFFGMNNLKSATPSLGNFGAEIFKILLLILFGVIAAGVGACLLIVLHVNMWIVLPVTVVLTVLLMKYLSPGELKQNLNRQFSIFNNKHNWIMTIIYTMTFGSFIGYSASFPKLIQDVFGYLPGGIVNPNAPNPMTWAFLGPMVGALIRPIGGWLSDKVGSGSKVTTWSTVTQVIAALGVSYFIIQAKSSSSPEIFWWPFFALFMVLFCATGVGNGSTFRSVPYIFNKEQAGPVLGWTSAIAAYGAFIIPKVFGEQIVAGHAEYALYGFTVYYLICLVLNWYYYDRKNSEVKC
ncbi:MAG: NarK/NasA family nitrate transporter [Candidatus Omnitrophica bacterium]|nr:NarK/NasA family nitrate transporter [Candidatus Omnitrophota bacterium]